MRGAASPAVHRDFGGHGVRVPADDLEAVATIRATGNLARFVPHAARLGVICGVAACGPAPVRGPAVGIALAAWRVSFEIGDVQCGDVAEARRYGDRRQAVLRTVVEDQVGKSLGSRVSRCNAECGHRTAHRRQPRDAARSLSRRRRPHCLHVWSGTMTVRSLGETIGWECGGGLERDTRLRSPPRLRLARPGSTRTRSG